MYGAKGTSMLLSLLVVVQQESEDKTVVGESSSKTAGVADKSEDIQFNPNVFTEFKLAGTPEVIVLLLGDLNVVLNVYNMPFRDGMYGSSG